MTAEPFSQTLLRQTAPYGFQPGSVLIAVDEGDDDRGLRVRQAMHMSIAPEAFEWLRHATYAHARTCGDDARRFEPLREWCAAQLTAWVSHHPERAEMPAGQIQATASGVARYVAEHYSPQRVRAAPRRTRDDRLAEELLITDFREITRKPTVRNVAIVAEISRSRAGRLLVRQGVSLACCRFRGLSVKLTRPSFRTRPG